MRVSSSSGATGAQSSDEGVVIHFSRKLPSNILRKPRKYTPHEETEVETGTAEAATESENVPLESVRLFPPLQSQFRPSSINDIQ